MIMMPLLEVNNLKAYFFTLQGPVKAVDDVTFSLERGESLGIAGESGCGKSTLALTLMRLTPPPGRIIEGNIVLDGINVLDLDNDSLRKIRWTKIAMIFQGALQALNPLFTIGDQIAEAILAHEPQEEGAEKEQVRHLLEIVGLEAEKAGAYPHELSGGMRQRSITAMALACDPTLLLADEPTTALDVIVQAQVLDTLKDLQKRLGLALILISHDLAIIAEMCDNVAIMYAGKIVERASADTIYNDPLHPYTQGLLSAFPSIKGPMKDLEVIPGSPPNLLTPPSGCRFHPRCKHAMKICASEEPKTVVRDKTHFVACHLVG